MSARHRRRAGQDGAANRLALKGDGVQHPVDLGKLCRHRKKAGLHARHAPGFGNADKLDPEAELRRIGEIDRRHVTDTGNRHPVELRCLAKGDGGEDGQLVRGVDAVDIKRRLGLGIAELLRIRTGRRQTPRRSFPCASEYSCRYRSGFPTHG